MLLLTKILSGCARVGIVSLEDSAYAALNSARRFFVPAGVIAAVLVTGVGMEEAGIIRGAKASAKVTKYIFAEGISNDLGSEGMMKEPKGEKDGRTIARIGIEDRAV